MIPITVAGRMIQGRSIVLRRTRSRFGENAADSKIPNHKITAPAVSKLSAGAVIL